ncbi:metallopeptidase family protein [Klenkia sp. PcliD-1-E]|uniref:metallopeptidase family protein n=1 Tax=Klenkia sp. PcliD-1-E TaxID=2954492 RepID=UPI0020984787|nr:metallopeptidase family protein [Klenkia sp. PcliD-1-E]MCO7219979.1 metallopeptidase family protein [Klenkia sp. PcliD-1-E]
MPRPPARRRDRHGRGLRGRLVPPGVPLSRSRSEQFDDLVLDAVEDIERNWEKELAGVEFAVEDVPWVDHSSPDEVVLDADVLDDGSVPLARVLPGRREGGVDHPPRIVVYRRPLEIRAHDPEDLADLVRDVVVDQVAVLLGRDPEEIDPTG